MPRYTRPDLAAIDPAEVSDYLLDRGIACQTRLERAGLVIESKVDATAALAAFVPTSTMDRTVFPFRSDYKPLPPEKAVPVTRLRVLRDAVRAGADKDPTHLLLADLVDTLDI